MQPLEQPKIGLVLGGGGARGLAHIHVLEVFDALGIKPALIAGTSIGAIFGAAYASGLKGSDIREMALQKLSKRTSIAKQLFVQRPTNLFDLWNLSLSNALLKPQALLNIVFDANIFTDFTDLDIPLKVIATDFYKQETVILERGSVLNAVAASMAIPGIFQPVTIDDQILIDGGMTNPLPFDTIVDYVDYNIAVDVTGGPVWGAEPKQPNLINVLFATSYILQNTIVKEKLKMYQPHVLLKPEVNEFPVLSFHKIAAILEASEHIRDELKYTIDNMLRSAKV